MLINQITVTGNAGRDPEMSYTQGGTAVTKFSIAVFQGKEKPTLWFNVVCWESLAERINEQVRKGNEVYVQGRLTMREYTDKNGVKRQAFEVVASSVQLTQKQDRLTSSAPSGTDNNDPLGQLEDHPF